MYKFKVIAALVGLTIALSGCASSSDIERKANMHAKSGEYYESIGQSTAAREEYNAANESRDSADDLFPILVELFNLFTKKKDN